MAITAHQFRNFAEHLLKSEIPNLNDAATTVNCALLDTVPTGTEDVWQDINANEITGDNYTAGGKEIGNKSVTESGGTATFDCNDINWPNSTIDARAAVLYEESTGILITYIDFGETKTSDNGDFRVKWNDSGLFTAAII